MTPRFRRRRGLTLIELITVVAIITLLLTVLLPAFSLAREQSRIAKCMANQHNIGHAATGYLFEQSKRADLPWTIPARMIAAGAVDSPYAFTNPSPFVWGGTIPDKQNDEFRAASPIYGAELSGLAAATFDVYRVPPRYRPLNRYLGPDVSWDCEPNEEMELPRANPTETPGVFRCPSDNTAKAPTLGRFTPNGPEDSDFSTWQYWGTSYAINWHWGAYFYHADPGNRPPYAGGSANQNRLYRMLGFLAPSPEGLGPRMLKNTRGNWSSNFVIFMENKLNFSVERARPPGYESTPWHSEPQEQVRGWHRQQLRHVATFLDGSVRYQSMNNRHPYGDSWTLWPARPWTDRWSAYNDIVP